MAYSKKPHSILRTKGDVVRQIDYRNEREARMFFGMSLLDNGFVKTKAEAQRAGAEIHLGQPVEYGGWTYKLDQPLYLNS